MLSNQIIWGLIDIMNSKNFQFGKDIIENACVKCKASLNLTEEQIEVILGDVKERIYQVIGDVPNE